jgi:hypothetical protein
MVDGTFVLSGPPALAGGPMPQGRWRLAGAEVDFPTDNVAGTPIDLAASRLRAGGVLGFDDGQAALDLRVDLHLATGALNVDRTFPISVAGPFTPLDAGDADFQVTCGQVPAAAGLHYAYDGEHLKLGLSIQGGAIEPYLLLDFVPVR